MFLCIYLCHPQFLISASYKLMHLWAICLWKGSKNISSDQFSCSVESDSLRPLYCSTPGFPVHHQLPELTRTHVLWVGDVILPSYPLSSPSPPAFSLPSTRVYFNESVLRIRWPKYWSFSISPSNEYSGLISFRIWSLFSPRDSQESSPTPQLKNINSSVLSFL